MAVSKKRKPNKKKLKVASRRGDLLSKEKRDLFKVFKTRIEDDFYDRLFANLAIVEKAMEEQYVHDISIEELDDFYAAKSINSVSNIITDFIREFTAKIPDITIVQTSNGFERMIDLVGHNEFMKVVNKLALTSESLLDDEFSAIARKYARFIMNNNKLKGNADGAQGLGSILIDRYLLEIDAKRALEVGIDPTVRVGSNTHLILKFIMNPEEFSEDPQLYSLDCLKAASESRQYWNVTQEEVEKYDGSGSDKPKEEPVQETLEEEETRPRYSYIGDWKELSSLAEEQGFTKVRQKGDHGVFRHKQGLTVIIPQGRPIGRGLSYEIQKALFSEDKTGSAWYGVNFH